MDPFIAYLWITIGAGTAVGVMSLFGGEDLDFEVGSDVDVGVDGDPEFSPFSPVMLAVFLTSFGMAGMTLEYLDWWGTVETIIASAVSALPVYLGMFYGMRTYLGTTTGVMKGTPLVGKTGIVRFPCGPGRIGSIEVTLKGTKHTYRARSPEAVDTDDTVEITAILGDVLEVKKIG